MREAQASASVIETPDECPFEWDLLLPEGVRLQVNGEWLATGHSGSVPGGRLRLEWKR